MYIKKRSLIRLKIYGTIVCLLLLAKVHAKQVEKKGPNIVWITCEDISPFIGVYGADLVKTPHIDQLAKEGVKYEHAYTAAGVCAPSRSSIITGMYPMSIGTQHMRTLSISPKLDRSGLPAYSAVIPAHVKAFPEYLRRQGYFTTNNEKTDYQFEAPVTVWDECGPTAGYRNRPDDRPFFSIFNLFITHESQIFSRNDGLLVDPANVKVPPYYKDTPIVRKDIARMLTNIQRMDQHVGEVIQQLKEDGLYENTYIFFFSDHGGSLPWTKRELLERGTHIPLIIRYPGGEHAGTVNRQLVSAVDFAPSVLSIAGIPIPAYLQGQAFIGSERIETERKYVFAGRDRMDEKYDRVRSVRDTQFRYVYNYMPEQPSYQDLTYRKGIPMMMEMLELHKEGKLDAPQEAWFAAPKAVEELYNVKNDPHELHNLAEDPSYGAKLQELRVAFQEWTQLVGDLSDTPEKEMVFGWWKGQREPPITAKPIVNAGKDGLTLSCNTDGASIGYRIVKADEEEKKLTQKVRTWDMRWVFNRVNNGDEIAVEPLWEVYNGTGINLQKGDKLIVQAMRIGFKPYTITYVQP